MPNYSKITRNFELIFGRPLVSSWKIWVNFGERENLAKFFFRYIYTTKSNNTIFLVIYKIQDIEP